MKLFKQLIFYKFCVLGGVERCLLNRSYLYKQHQLPFQINVCFLESSEIVDIFKQHIQNNNLDDHLKVIEFKQIEAKHYDLITSLDTPEVFDLYDAMTVECHTGYLQNSKYLQSLPKKIKNVSVPSPHFAESLTKLYPLEKIRITVLPNFVLKSDECFSQKKIWNKKIIFYFGRLDPLKNTKELIQIFMACKKLSDNLLFYIMSPNILQMKHWILSNPKLCGNTILSTGVHFDQTANFLNFMKNHEAIYVSASKNESFGFSTAEVLAHGIPAMLSDIPAHQYLVQNDTRFLYRRGNPAEAAKKIMDLFQNYHILSLNLKPIENFLTRDLANEHVNKITNLTSL